MTVITSTQNTIVRHAHALLTQHRIRKKSGETILEGVHLLDAYLKQQLTIKTILVSQTASVHHEVSPILQQINPKNIMVLEDKLYKQIRTLGDGIDIMAIIDTPSPTLPDAISSDCLILDGLQDAGNIGTLLRTAAAIGINTILTTPNTANLWSPKCLRAGMGAHFGIDIFEHITPHDILTTVKARLFATSSHTDKVIYDHNLNAPIAWVFGHEGQGVSDIFLHHATAIALPQPNGQESLNVGVAGSVCLYEMLRQRHFAT